MDREGRGFYVGLVSATSACGGPGTTMTKLLTVVLMFVVSPFFFKSEIVGQRKAAKPRITGIYSNMRYIEDAGDVVGMEIFIVAGGDGYYATVQIAEGEPAPPVVVKLEVKDSDIEFTLPAASGLSADKFTGKISANGITGKFQNAVEKEFLTRRRSYWQ